LLKLLLSLAAFGAGTLIAVQAGINAQLARAAGASLVAATISFAVGLAALGIACVAARTAWPSITTLKAIPPHLLIGGGLLGATYVFGAIMLAPRLGAGALIALIVTGQLIAALVLDQFGLAGFAVHELTPGRAFGACLLVAGVVLVRFY
jgi:transporter family-2 protein